MSANNSNLTFKFLTVIAWILFVGLCIEAGGLIVNFVFTMFQPEFLNRLYQKMDLSALHQQHPLAFYLMYGLVLIIAVLKAFLFYKVVMLVTKLNLEKPFNADVSRKISQISYYTLIIGLTSYVARMSARSLQDYGGGIEQLDPFWVDSEAFILTAAIVYVIAAIFKKGIELQNENDLTV